MENVVIFLSFETVKKPYDKLWFFTHNPETKCHSMHWKPPYSQKLKKVQKSKFKAMIIEFFHIQVIVYIVCTRRSYGEQRLLSQDPGYSLWTNKKKRTWIKENTLWILYIMTMPHPVMHWMSRCICPRTGSLCCNIHPTHQTLFHETIFCSQGESYAKRNQFWISWYRETQSDRQWTCLNKRK